ncbi:DUF1007 family protein [Nitrobacter sp. TKz-YC01]
MARIPCDSDRRRYSAALVLIALGIMSQIRAIICLALLFLAATPMSAGAHPHVWVTIRSEVLYTPEGLMTGIRHAWTFDDMFSAYALQGIQHAKKGQYTREELSSLADVNVTSLKENDYFTYAKADGRKAVFSDPVDYWLEYKDSALILHFTLPLKAPVAAKAMLIEVYDPTIFVDFGLAKDQPVALAGAPASCQLIVDSSRAPTADEQLRMSQLDQNPLDSLDTFGQGFSNKIRIKCP